VENMENLKELKMFMQIGSKVLKDAKDTTKMVLYTVKKSDSSKNYQKA
jgi:hypothetical protein